jgi:dynein heavy chain, axonemal
MDHSIPMVSVSVRKLSHTPAYDPVSSRKLEELQIDKVWTAQLLDQVNQSVARLLKYIDSLDCIHDEDLSQFKTNWVINALALIQPSIQNCNQLLLKSLFAEVQLGYKRSMKQAIMDYVLRSPDERRRLHIILLPQSILSAHERKVQQGGFSTLRYQGTHHRKVQAENEIKFRLTINNVVTSSL